MTVMTEEEALTWKTERSRELAVKLSQISSVIQGEIGPSRVLSRVRMNTASDTHKGTAWFLGTELFYKYIYHHACSVRLGSIKTRIHIESYKSCRTED